MILPERVPILYTGCLAVAEYHVSDDVYAWIIVLVLPINALTNSFLHHRKHHLAYKVFRSFQQASCLYDKNKHSFCKFSA